MTFKDLSIGDWFSWFPPVWTDIKMPIYMKIDKHEYTIISSEETVSIGAILFATLNLDEEITYVTKFTIPHHQSFYYFFNRNDGYYVYNDQYEKFICFYNIDGTPGKSEFSSTYLISTMVHCDRLWVGNRTFEVLEQEFLN